ncbi:nuclease-related domain-containing protein [Nocardioides sp. WV_118_6]|uniref:nuclease-related domain-containing protein n=1 Tax=Nocardioides simplex TaxID=2045 RepID=UPI0021505374|nr:nuclease-related domain-containing protein [Pimelobacter simplex]UUW90413.1 NERD domain-containing protein [Pimelobacter simplex]UUW94243.1 NERD domain-containing protein [Pimelobacter simplex]
MDVAGAGDPIWVVKRWRRYGNDRLYVELADGAKVGYWDLVADTAHPSTPADEALLLRAVADWKGGHQTAPAPPAPLPAAPRPEPGRAPEPEPEPDPEPVAPLPWIDLATTPPGAAAREQAEAARAAAPIKTVLARVLGVHTDERAWRLGAVGEEQVAAQLAKVARDDGRWRFLHAIPVGNRGSDIDHLVIGPGGVFTVNTKHHPGASIWVGGETLLVNGTRQPYIRNARHEAERAGRLLSAACGYPVHVGGLVVPVNTDEVVVKSQPAGVAVVPRRRLAGWLRRHGEIHPPSTVEAIFAMARRSTTWQ